MDNATAKTITLRFPAVCRECAGALAAGSVAAFRPFAHARDRIAHAHCDELVEARALRSRAFTIGPWGRLLDERELATHPAHLAAERLVRRAEQIEARVAAAQATASEAAA